MFSGVAVLPLLAAVVCGQGQFNYGRSGPVRPTFGQYANFQQRKPFTAFNIPKSLALAPAPAFAPTPVFAPAPAPARNPSAYTSAIAYSRSLSANPNFSVPSVIQPYKPTSNAFKSAELSLDRPASVIADEVISQAQETGAKVVNALRRLGSNKIISTLLNGGVDPSDPCAVLPENLDDTIQTLTDIIASSRNELVLIIEAGQEMKRNENDASKQIEAASKVVKALEPLLPTFQTAFRKNPECNSTIESTINRFNAITDALTTLGSTNLVSSDPVTKKKILQGGEASKIITRTAVNLSKGNFANLCSDSPAFTKNVLKGVEELLAGLRDIQISFNANPADIKKLSETTAFLREGADLLGDLNFEIPNIAVPAFSPQCTTSLPAVSRTLSEVAELVDAIDPKSFQ